MVVIALLLALVHDLIVFVHNVLVDFNKLLTYASHQIIILVERLES